jgi:hypothetical protein
MTWIERGIWAALMAFWVIVLGFCVNKAVFGQEVPQQRGPLGIQPTAERIELGRKLFFDPRLSQDGTIACATCHDPNRGWSDGRTVAVGIRNQSGTRNSPTIINATYNDLVFWDGRTIGATTQALLPLVNPIEMGVQTEQQILRRLQLIPGYVALFANAFPPSSYDRVTGSPITGANLGLAVSSFESTVVSFNAPIDRYLAGEENVLERRCAGGLSHLRSGPMLACHAPPLWTDNRFHNNGSEFAGKPQITDQGRFSVVPPIGGRVTRCEPSRHRRCGRSAGQLPTCMPGNFRICAASCCITTPAGPIFRIARDSDRSAYSSRWAECHAGRLPGEIPRRKDFPAPSTR